MRPSLAYLDKTHIWHPFTQQAEWVKKDPILVTSAKGVWLKDARGRKFLDGNSSLWVNVWGHGHPRLDQAVRRQLRRMAHTTFLGLTHEPAIRLAQALVRIAPKGLSRVFYSDNGSTAVEVALKMAYQYWQLKGEGRKSKFVSLKEGYHGDTVGAVSVGGIDLFHARFKSLLFKGWQVKHHDLESTIRRHQSDIAAVLMEPLIQGATGMRLHPKGFLSYVARVCRRHNVLLIVDEVATGFGRTGTMFACEQESVAPDFLCAGKSITGGYLPLAATLTSEKIYRTFLGRYEKLRHFFHGHTYTANPLACAVAVENLRMYRQKRLLVQVRQRARELAQGLAPLRANPLVQEVRQIGLMAGIELIGPRMGHKACEAAIRRGVWLRPLGNVVVLMPPLAITAKEMAFLVRKVQEAVAEVAA